jgi:SAM-dependent methyltransferase
MGPELFRLHADLESTHWWFTARRAIICSLVDRLLAGARHALVVDVGCGTGANIAALADRYRCIGIDTSEEGVRLAQERFPTCRFVPGFAPADLGRAAGEADVFMLMDVLEHVQDDFHLLSSLIAASRPGAHFVITVPADPALWSGHDVAFGHYRRYLPPRLAQTWSGLPVSLRLLSPLNYRLYPVIRAVRTASRALGRTAGRDSTDFSIPGHLTNRMLERIFAGEHKAILARMDRSTPEGFARRGVSLLAVLRREEGDAEARQRPAGVEPDLHDPGKQESDSAPEGTARHA